MNNYNVDKKLNQKIQFIIDKYLQKEHTKLSVAVIYKDESRVLNFNKDFETDRYDIGSISKTMTSLLVLHEIEKKKLNFDDIIDKYLALKEGYYPTIYQLLSHTCDYYHFTPVEIVIPSLLTKRYSKKNIYEKINNSHIIKSLEKRRKHKIKGKYGYSDFAYAILAVVLEKVSNQPFFQIMNDFLNNHLGLKDTYCINSNDLRLDCYLKRKKITNWRWLDDNPYLASGGISSTIKDMHKFLNLMLFSEDDVIKRSIFNYDYEKKHNVSFFLSKNKHVFWHVGGIGQFRASLTINPKRKIGIIVLGNSSGVRKGNVHYICKMIYTDIRRNRLFEDLKRVNEDI